MIDPRRTRSLAWLVALALVAAACTGGAEVDEPAVAVARPTPAPTATPAPEPRLDPSGNPIPTPGSPARPDVADPSAEIADVAPVLVEMLDVPDPSPTPVGLEISAPTPTPPADEEPVDQEPTTDADGTGPTAEPEPLPTAVGPDGPPIRVAGLITATVGPLDIASGTCVGARARFERANRDFELDRPIEFVNCFDDRGDQVRNRQLADQLTDDGRIFALVPATSVALFADDLLNERHVPYIGVGDLPAFCGFEQSFGFGEAGAVGCPALAATATPVVAVPHLELYALASGVDVDGLKVALVRSDTIGGELFAASVGLEAALVGAELVLDSASVPSAAEAERRGWSEVISEVVDSNAELVIIDGDRTAGLYDGLRIDFDGDIVGTSYADPAAFTDDSDLLAALSGSYQISQGFDAVAQTGADWPRYRLDTASIGVDQDDLDRDVLSGYVAADLLMAALAVTPTPITPEALHNIVNNGWQYPGIDGLACAGWWPASHVVSYPCGAVARVNPLDGPLESVVPLTEFDLVVRTPAEAAADGD